MLTKMDYMLELLASGLVTPGVDDWLELGADNVVLEQFLEA